MSEVQRYKDRCNDSGSVPDQTHIDDLEELEQLRQLCREQHEALKKMAEFPFEQYQHNKYPDRPIYGFNGWMMHGTDILEARTLCEKYKKAMGL